MPLHLGKQPATYDKRDIRLTDVRASLPLPLTNIPATWGHGADFTSTNSQPTGWGMMGNGPQDDGSVPAGWAAAGGAGDCVFAGGCHEERQAAHEAKRPIPTFSCLTTLNQYKDYSGYDLKTGRNDNGSNVREVLSLRQKQGLYSDSGHVYKIGTYVSLEPTNWQELREACYLFEAVGIGINFPESAMNQFNAGQIWSVVAGAQIEGGHYIPLLGHPQPGLWTCVTWGRRQLMTWNFIAAYCEEAWCYISMERYNQVTGETAEGYNDVDLEKYIKLFMSA